MLQDLNLRPPAAQPNALPLDLENAAEICNKAIPVINH